MRYLACLILLLSPFEAFALSCFEPSVARTFHQLNEAPEDYIVVEGRLTLDMGRLPRPSGGMDEPPEMTRIPAVLTGKSMSATGFDVPFEKEITLEVSCWGPWCGDAQNGMEVLGFVRRDGADYSLAIDPCRGHIFENQRKLQREVLQCYEGKACVE